MSWLTLPNGDQIGVQPVSLLDFAEFVRSLDYFKPHHWVLGAPPEATGGDQVLRRLGFRWPRRNRPVEGVSWHEARAFCFWRGGRLPWLSDWEFCRDSGGLADGPPEWCGEWYHPSFTGPQVVRPWGTPPMRRVAGGRQPMAEPNHFAGGIGFRLVLPAGTARI